MDLHFTDACATPEEQAAVDSVLGPANGSGSSRNGHDGRALEAGRLERERRHLLLPVLHAIQDRAGWISEGALNYACRRLTLPPAEAYGVASFYGLFSTTPRPQRVVHVCDDIACLTRGAAGICKQLESTVGPAGTPCSGGRATWLRSPCLGQCERAPAAMLTVAGERPAERVLPLTNAEAIDACLREAVVPKGPPDVFDAAASVPRRNPSGALLRRAGSVDPGSLAAYTASGGYRALAKAIDLGPEAVIQEVIDSRLLGRGGAAFPCGRKWQAVARELPPRYLVCNADESEPGTFKDRVLMEADPFQLVEAMTIAGFATGCETGYLFIRGEYPLARERMAHAVAAAREACLLGPNVMGSGRKFEIEIRRGAGAYICGEETALFNSIEGRRGEPRNKPPFPTQSGLFGRPTLVNNVETLVNIPALLLLGGAAYAETGSGQSTGTKLYCLSGHVQRPGVYEFPFGATLGQALQASGGVAGSGRLQAVLLGGAAGGFVGPAALDTPLTFEGVRAAGASLGSAVIMAFDDTVDLGAIILRIAAFFRDESCGQCVPCRVGTVRQEELLTRVAAGRPLGSLEDERRLFAEIAQVMRDASICGLGQTAASATESALRQFHLFGWNGGAR